MTKPQTRPILILLTLAFSTAATVSASSTAEAKKLYETDTQKVHTGDLSFDWREFRLAATTAGVGGGLDWHPVRVKFMQQMKDGTSDQALASARTIVEHNMAEPEGHLLAMMALQKLNRSQDALFERKVVDAIAHSILDSGDGTSKEKAFFVVNEGEEYFLLNVVMGYGFPASQSLVSASGHSFDLMKVKDSRGAEKEIWFNVDTSMNAMREALGEK